MFPEILQLIPKVRIEKLKVTAFLRFLNAAGFLKLQRSDRILRQGSSDVYGK
ncbi:hypothetical protein LEP1GSC179_1383 [Leptospira santarosai str. MOR084]|uniref:Uncharacterized protein n=1 Tax=Leptospira santarosai str. MOR084 TaxID=1049984 RepID=A0A0E2BAF5_9LEPT|nr:hypothetical protein LEP1GSC179_1383 [Leptospira santarosai str. MOR084]